MLKAKNVILEHPWLRDKAWENCHKIQEAKSLDFGEM